MALVETRVKVETTLLPPLDFQLGGGGAARPNLALRILKPRVTVFVNGQPMIAAAPLGEPGRTRWPAVRLILIAGGIILGLQLARIVKGGIIRTVIGGVL